MTYMDIRTSYAAGTPCWIDVGAADIPQAVAFYEALFGWKVEGPPRPEFGGYTNMTQAGHRVAGVSPKGDPIAPDYWAVSIAVADVAKTLDKVTLAGGSVLFPGMPVGDLGTMAIITDVHGTYITLWQPGTHKGCGLVNTPNSFVWNELSTPNLRASAEFYSKVFGWGIDWRQEAEGSVSFYVDSTVVCGAHAITEGEFPSWFVWFSVNDADGMADHCLNVGGSVFSPAADMPFGRAAVLSAPGGAVFGVISQPASA
jgi:uncharacterized protein